MINPTSLEKFSQCYLASFNFGIFMAGISNDINYRKDLLLENAYDAFKYFTQYAHERQGTNKNFHVYNRVAIQETLNNRIFDDTVLNDDLFPSEVWTKFRELTKDWLSGEEKSNKSHTIGPVRDVLFDLKREDEPNIIRLLGNKTINEANTFLRSLKGIGGKISALLLRDLQEYYNFWEMDESNYYFLQPVDIWVNRLSHECWTEYMPSNNHDHNAMEITNLCLKNDINPLRFNMGAWFIGSHYRDLCRFHKISENESININNSIEQFEFQNVTNALHKYLINFVDGSSFPF